MTPLLTGRNPQGDEKNWYLASSVIPRIENEKDHIGKVIATEVGLFFLATAALVETVVYTALFIACFPLSIITCCCLCGVCCPIVDVLENLTTSSALTLAWAIRSLFYDNITSINVVTHESFFRYEVSSSFGLIRRYIDMQYIAAHSHPSSPLYKKQPTYVTDEDLNQGANFLVNEVLANASDDTKDRFSFADHDLIMFIVTKSVYIYAFGSRREFDIPNFFQTDTQTSINHLRTKSYPAAVLNQLEASVATPEAYDADSEESNTAATLSELREIASREIQGGKFVTKCWKRAAKQLDQPPPPPKKNNSTSSERDIFWGIFLD